MPNKGKRRCDQLPVLHPDASGIDVGASELFVAVSADRDPQPIRRFPLSGIETAARAEKTTPKRTKASPCQRRRYEPSVFDLRSELYRIFGVDLTNVPGISAVTAQPIRCEIGTDVSRFRNASAFASWLGLCPERKISGGKVLDTRVVV